MEELNTYVYESLTLSVLNTKYFQDIAIASM